MNADLSKTGRQFVSFFRRFHMIIFFLLVSISLAAAILILLSIINASNTPSDETNELISGSFDKDTIDRINALRQDQLTQPGNRPSPFEE